VKDGTSKGEMTNLGRPVGSAYNGSKKERWKSVHKGTVQRTAAAQTWYVKKGERGLFGGGGGKDQEVGEKKQTDLSRKVGNCRGTTTRALWNGRGHLR